MRMHANAGDRSGSSFQRRWADPALTLRDTDHCRIRGHRPDASPHSRSLQSRGGRRSALSRDPDSANGHPCCAATGRARARDASTASSTTEIPTANCMTTPSLWPPGTPNDTCGGPCPATNTKVSTGVLQALDFAAPPIREPSRACPRGARMGKHRRPSADIPAAQVWE